MSTQGDTLVSEATYVPVFNLSPGTILYERIHENGRQGF